MAVPQTPALPRLTATDTTITATWAAPASDSRITSYDLEWREGTSGAWTRVTGITILSHIIRGRRARTRHQVRVRANSREGAGLWSGQVSLGDSSIASATAGVLVAGVVDPARLGTGLNIVYPPNAATRITDSIDSTYIEGGVTTYWSALRLRDDGRMDVRTSTSPTSTGSDTGPQFTADARSKIWIVAFYGTASPAWDFSQLDDSDSTEPYRFSAASVAAAGPTNDAALRAAINRDSTVKAMLVDSSHDAVDIAALAYQSSLASITTMAATPTAPDVPTGVSLAQVDSDTVRGSWTAVAGATSYQGQIKQSSSGVWVSIDSDITSPHDFDLLVAGTSYDFRVRASNAAGSSAYSAAASASTAAPPPPPLAVTDFVTPAGRQNVVAALFERSSHAAWLWRLDQNLGRMIGGDIGTITRLNYNRSTTHFQINDTPNAPDLNTVLASGGDWFDYHIHIQDSQGVASFPVDGTPVDGSGAHFFRWRSPTAFDTVAARIGNGERFIFAMTEPAPPATELPLYVGDTRVDKIYIGDTEVDAAALGATEVF